MRKAGLSTAPPSDPIGGRRRPRTRFRARPAWSTRDPDGRVGCPESELCRIPPRLPSPPTRGRGLVQARITPPAPRAPRQRRRGPVHGAGAGDHCQSRISGRSSPWRADVAAGARSACSSAARALRRRRSRSRGTRSMTSMARSKRSSWLSTRHVERRGRGALLLVAAHVEVVVVGAPVGQPVDQPRVAVVGEDHRLVAGEQRVEVGVGQPVRVLARRPAAASGRRR